MTAIVWDQPQNRNYEYGVSNGVLYYGSGAFPWSGLISVEDTSTPRYTSIYVDGFKIADAELAPEYAGTIKCVTYPQILNYLMGMESDASGVSHDFTNFSKRFHMSFMTKGSDGDGKETDFLHLLYNISATPDNRTYTTYGQNVTPTEFSFKLTSTPVEFFGGSPSTHFIVDLGQISADRRTILLNTLHGHERDNPRMPDIQLIINVLINLKEVRIVSEGNLILVETNEITYASENEDGLISFDYPARISPAGPDVIDFDLTE